MTLVGRYSTVYCFRPQNLYSRSLNYLFVPLLGLELCLITLSSIVIPYVFGIHIIIRFTRAEVTDGVGRVLEGEDAYVSRYLAKRPGIFRCHPVPVQDLPYANSYVKRSCWILKRFSPSSIISFRSGYARQYPPVSQLQGLPGGPTCFETIKLFVH